MDQDTADDDDWIVENDVGVDAEEVIDGFVRYIRSVDAAGYLQQRQVDAWRNWCRVYSNGVVVDFVYVDVVDGAR